MSESRLTAPIFILGASKSGTTLLLSLLDGHEGLFAVPVESHFFQYVAGFWVDYALRRAPPVEVPLAGLGERMVRSARLLRADDSRRGGPTWTDFNLQCFANYIDAKPIKNLADAFTLYVRAWYFTLRGEELPEDLRAVEKSVENAEYASVLRGIFPGSVFVHIVRNPYATLVALRKYKQIGPYPYLGTMASSLYNSYYYLCRNCVTLDGYLVVRYEDLVSSPEATMRRVARHIDIDYSERLLVPTLRGRPWGGNSTSEKQFQGISDVAANAWREEIRPFEIHLVNSFARPVLERFGYDSLVPPRSWRWPVARERPLTYLRNRALTRVLAVGTDPLLDVP